ncbi:MULTISPECIES: ExbD/TolR family protein [Hydrogenophaga]|uniref:Biopolymer transporter n=1 Tax=Hydrogenophaga electricum TaxID=1230953 RepID=A0ABQ6CE24_9BURK|nr:MULTISPECIES: biopolymer transporter ExbD [Hydrogenophaga]GLS16497.1 biopolymer transporter [Hydrogenophaga electricum]
MASAINDFDDGDDADVSDINMTPLVDVMLVLLIIFIITVPVLTHSVKLDLPRAQAEVNRVEPQTVTISVDAQGLAHWDEVAVSEAELASRLQAAAQQQPQPELHIRGDRKAEYESVLQVMAAAQRAGVLKLGFVTEPGAVSGP